MKASVDEAVLFIHSTGTGPVLWAGVPDAAVGGRQKLLPANLGYPPNERVERGTRLGSLDDAAQVVKAVPPGVDKVHLVAHSYGALVALNTIPALGDRLASVFFYEPVAFAAFALAPENDPAAAKELKAFLDHPWFLSDEERGGREEWQEKFIDYWNRPGSWSRMPEHLRAMSLEVGWKMFQEVRACFFDEAPVGGWHIPAPTTIAVGDRTTVASRAISKGLAYGRPNVTLVDVPGVGHMAPLTHAVRVHEELARHMARVTEGPR